MQIDPVAELKERFIETQHSRILVYQNSIDNIIGYFELKDIFKNPADIKSLYQEDLQLFLRRWLPISC